MGRWFNQNLLNANFIIGKKKNVKNLDSKKTTKESSVIVNGGDKGQPQPDISPSPN